MAHSPLEFLYERFTRTSRTAGASPRDDVLTGLATATFPDGSTPEVIDVVRVAANLFAAGQETTVRLLAAAHAAARRGPDAAAARCATSTTASRTSSRSRCGIESPVKGDFRLARVPTDRRRRRHPRGHHPHGAERRRQPRPPPLRGPRPSFDVDRANARQHLAFGHGVHTCPGAPLARAEGASASSACSTAWPTSASPRRSTDRRATGATPTRPRSSCAGSSSCTWSTRRSADARREGHDVGGTFTRRTTATLCSVVLAAVALAVVSAAAVAGAQGRDSGPKAKLTPLKGGEGVYVGTAIPVNLKKNGYVQYEYKAAGKATSYTEESERTADGRWTFAEDETAPYATARDRPPAQGRGEVQRHRDRRVDERERRRRRRPGMGDEPRGDHPRGRRLGRRDHAAARGRGRARCRDGRRAGGGGRGQGSEGDRSRALRRARASRRRLRLRHLHAGRAGGRAPARGCTA